MPHAFFFPLCFLGKFRYSNVFKNWKEQKNKSLWNQVMSAYEHKDWHSNYANKKKSFGYIDE